MIRQPLIDFHGASDGAGQRLHQLSLLGLPHCVKAIDNGGWAREAADMAIRHNVPHTIVFRQTAPGGLKNDHPDLNLEPAEAAFRLWAAVLSTMPQELHDVKRHIYVEPTNEIDTPSDNDERLEWVAKFCVETAKLMLEDGWNPALAGWNTGQPSHAQIVGHFGELLKIFEEYHDRCLWTYHEAKLKHTKKRPDGSKYIVDHDSPLVEFDGYMINTAHKIVNACKTVGRRVPRLFVSESAWAYDELAEKDQFRSEVDALASLDAKTPQIVGRVIWNAKKGQQWGKLDQQVAKHTAWLTDYVINSRIEAAEPKPEPEPEPEPKPQKRLFKRTYVLLSPGAAVSGEWGEAIAATCWLKRWTVGYSADDAGIGEYLPERRVIAVNPGGWASDLKTFFDEYYPGVDYVPVNALTPKELNNKLRNFIQSGSWQNPPKPKPIFEDISDKLPKHPQLTYKKRELRNISHYVIHHTAVDPNTPIANIATYHVNQGWPGIGYHFVITQDGKIYQTNKLETISYHSYNENHYSLGICLAGNFTSKPPTQAQINAAAQLIDYLKKELPSASKIVPHRKMKHSSTACPGNTWENWFGKISGEEESTDNSKYNGPAVKFVRLITQPASDWNWPNVLDVFNTSGIKPLFYSSGTNYQWYNAFRHPTFAPVRLNPSHTFNSKTAMAFYKEIETGLLQFYRQGARDFIVLNECNLEHKESWRNGYEFGLLFKDLCAIIKINAPGVRLWYPGTSPQWGAQHTWIADSLKAGADHHIYGMVQHVYTMRTDNAEAAVQEMVAEVKDFQRRYALRRPMIIGEFAVVMDAPASYKAKVYKLFYNNLENIPGIAAAASFTSSWANNPDETTQGWYEHGIHREFARL